jgi:hypothetical protein
LVLSGTNSNIQVQDAGAFISTANPSTLSNMATASTLSTFSNRLSLNISSLAQISQLTIDQINSLIKAVETQIINESNQITNNQVQILTLQSSINTVPGGLQDLYDALNSQYISVQQAYIRASTIQNADISTLNGQIFQMELLSTLSTSYASSIEAYQRNYSSLYSEIYNNNHEIEAEESTFQSLFKLYTDDISAYNNATTNLNKEITSINILSHDFSTITSKYNIASTTYGNDLSELNRLSSILSIATQSSNKPIISTTISTIHTLSTNTSYDLINFAEIYSTLKSISSQQVNSQNNYNNLSDMIHRYSSIGEVLASEYGSTLLNISNLLYKSTLYNQSIAMYISSYYFYSTIEAIAELSIMTYSTLIGYNKSTMLGYQGTIDILTGQLVSEYNDLNKQAGEYYKQKHEQLNNEINEFKYGIQEWNSFVGYVIAELITYKLNLYTQIDYITFHLQQNLTTDQINTDSNRRSELTTLQSNIQKIVDLLNPLDTEFNNVLINLDSEVENKTTFIDTRSTLTAYEIKALQVSSLQYSDEFKSAYIDAFNRLNTCVLNIEPQISGRINAYRETIDSVLDAQLPMISNLNLDGQNIFSYIIQPDPIDTNVITFTSRKNEFILLSTIDYGLDPVQYNSVLGVP